MTEKDNVPVHIAIIMDGNGRWAKQRGLPKIMGHRRGVDSVRDILKACSSLGVKYLTLYTFSTENWKRPKREVDAIMRLLESQLEGETKNLHKNNVRLNVIGRVSLLPEGVRRRIKESMECTKNNTGVVLTLAIAYGSRAEIVDAAVRIMAQVEDGALKKEDINEETFARFLDTRDMPDPDLLIRTSGEMRISNFLLWQISYAEIYITKKLWPDFRKSDLEAAIREYRRRRRRYGV